MADRGAEGAEPSPPRAADLLAGIRQRERDVVATGDPTQIKALYAELSEVLDRAYGADLEAVPVLSRPETLVAITRLLGPVEGVILDAGCGPNPVAALAIGDDAVRTIVGLDLGFGTVRLARGVAAAAGVRVLAVVGDLEALPFRRDAFDALVCDDTLEHVPDDAGAVHELARVVRPQGRLVLATPNRWNLDVVLRKLADRARGAAKPRQAYFVASSHLREYRWGELRRLVEPAFRIRRRAPVGWLGGPKKRAASRLMGLPGARAVDQMLVFEAEVR